MNTFATYIFRTHARTCVMDRLQLYIFLLSSNSAGVRRLRAGRAL